MHGSRARAVVLRGGRVQRAWPAPTGGPPRRAPGEAREPPSRCSGWALANFGGGRAVNRGHPGAGEFGHKRSFRPSTEWP